MSRRLENINVGFTDTSNIGQAYTQGYAQSNALVKEEEARQKRLQDEEDSRLSTGAAIYNQGYSQLEQFKGDLATDEKVAFANQFDNILKSYTELQNAVGKGIKVGSADYMTLQNGIQQQKDGLLMKIGALKEVNKAKAQILSNIGSGLITDPSLIKAIDDTRSSLLKGQYVASTQMPKAEDVIRNSYKPAYGTINQFASGVQLMKDSAVDYTKDGKKTERVDRVIPIYGSMASLAANKLNPENTDSRELTGIMKDAQKFVSSSNAESSPEYQYYKIYMNNDVVKNDPLYTGVKSAKDFSPADYLMMETITRKFKPTAIETEAIVKPTGGRGGGTSGVDTALMDSMMNDLFGTDSVKRKNVVNKLNGALKVKGWDISLGNTGVNVNKAKDEYTSGISGLIKNTGDATDKSMAMSMINAYFSAIGKGGKAIAVKK